MAEITEIDDRTTSGIDGSVSENGSTTDSGNGIGNNANGSGSFEFTNVDGSEGKKRRTRRTKEQIAQDNTNGTKRASKSDKVNGQKAATFLINKLETISSRVLNKDTSLNMDEHLFIDEPLAALLAQMDMSAVDKYSKIINPILVLFGLMLWYVRIAPKPTVNNSRKVSQNGINSNPVSTTETTFTPDSPKDYPNGDYESTFGI